MTAVCLVSLVVDVVAALIVVPILLSSRPGWFVLYAGVWAAGFALYSRHALPFVLRLDDTGRLRLWGLLRRVTIRVGNIRDVSEASRVRLPWPRRIEIVHDGGRILFPTASWRLRELVDELVRRNPTIPLPLF